MTCHQAVPLLDDYLDGELTPPQVAELERHLASCPACTSELESAKRLRELLTQSRESASPPEPRPDYWSEAEALILARTVESTGSNAPERTRVTELWSRPGTGQLVRSLMLFAASLVLMISAIYVGSQRKELARVTINPQSPVYLSGSASGMTGEDHGLVLTSEEKTSLVRGMFALGAPGPVGRYTTIADLLGSY